MKLCLGVDAGITTGFALVTREGYVLNAGDLEEAPLIYGRTILTHYARLPDLEVVVEAPVPSGLGDLSRRLHSVNSSLRGLFPGARFIRAADWKLTPMRNALVPNPWDGRPLSTHVKDAIRIAHWYWTFKYMEVVDATANA